MRESIGAALALTALWTLSPYASAAEEASSCEPFSTEAVMRSIPVYDQQFSGSQDQDSGICYAVVAAHMFDHWRLSRSGAGQRQELVSPLMIHIAKQWYPTDEDNGGGELSSKILAAMAQRDLCTLGVAPGSRPYLSIDDELNTLTSNLGRGGARAGQGQAALEGLYDREAFMSAAHSARRAPCRAVPAVRVTPKYMRTRQVMDGATRRTRGVPISEQEFKGFLAQNTARQPVAVKFRYPTILGDPPQDDPPRPPKGGRDTHWALVVARQQREGRCRYLIRNSMGRDHELVWTDEERLIRNTSSMALLAP